MSLRKICGKFLAIKEAEADPEDFRKEAEAIIEDKIRKSKLRQLEDEILKVIGDPYNRQEYSMCGMRDFRLEMYQMEKSHGYSKAVTRMAEAILDDKL